MSEIKLLIKCPQYAAILAYWSYNQWYRDRNVPFDLLIKSYAKRASSSALPILWVAIEDGIPVGMVSLKKNDLASRKDLKPWLSSLYVVPEFRRKGIAVMLIDAVLLKGKELGFERLHLFLGGDDNAALERYYCAMGWEILGQAVDCDGKETKIFTYRIIE